MADSAYTKFVDSLAQAGINLVTDTIKVVACTSAYVANMATDEFLSSIASGARKSTATLSSKTFSGGVFDAADALFAAVAAGSTLTQLVIYKDTGSDATSRLIWRIDSYVGFPVTTDGTDIPVAWPNDANKIFKIGA